MQGRRVTRINIFTIFLCVLAFLLTAAVIVISLLQPAAEPLAATSELPVFDTEVPTFPQLPPPTEPDTTGEQKIVPNTTDPEEDTDIPDEPPRIITAHPVRMIIPALELDYEIQMTISDARGNMQIAPYHDVVSWFDLGAIPGNEGNAIFGCHNIWRGIQSQVYHLDLMEIGDEMIIEYDDETSIIFMLESVFVYPLATAPAHLIMAVDTEPRVTLITCKPPFNPAIGTSDNRIVATFREDAVFVYPDPPVEPFPPREK